MKLASRYGIRIASRVGSSTRNAHKVAVVLLSAMVLAASGRLLAHIGSPDVFVQGAAGPYQLFVTVRPPLAIPGVAAVDILVTTPDVREVRIVPTPLTGAAAKFAPTPDRAERSGDDPRRFTGHLWMMSAGAWQIRITVDGAAGTGDLSVPVPTLPQVTSAMSPVLGTLLFGCMLLLAAGVVAIVSAMAREGALDAGEVPSLGARRRGRLAGAIAAVVVISVVSVGHVWWRAEAESYARYVYKPLAAATSISDTGRLTLALSDPGWISLRRVDDLVPDHGHLMHFFLVSPALDRLWHLHPRAAGTATFEQALPRMPNGEYEFFADIVHATGISETVTGRLNVPEMSGSSIEGDDSGWAAVSGTSAADPLSSPLPDGGRIVWVRDATPLRTKQLTVFAFRIDGPDGQPATDLELYMGMTGHAVFVRRDRRVFAHVHPSGSAPMATLDMGRQRLAESGDAKVSAIHAHESTGLPATITFPYGFPEPGDYRVFVQVKRAGRIDTGAFDAQVR